MPMTLPALKSVVSNFLPVIKAGIAVVLLSAACAFAFNHLRPERLLLLQPKEALEAKFSDFERLDSLLADPETVLLDAREAKAYALWRIPRAKNIPPEALGDEERLRSLLSYYEKDDPIVVYCSDPLCPMAENLAAALRERGFERVSVFSPGFDGWLSAGRKPEE